MVVRMLELSQHVDIREPASMDCLALQIYPTKISYICVQRARYYPGNVEWRHLLLLRRDMTRYSI